jgi:signal peptidase I
VLRRAGQSPKPDDLTETAIGPSVEDPHTRRVRPILALLAGLLEFGLGYVYVGQLRRALASIGIFYGIIAFFAWTCLVLYSALLWWLVCAGCLLVIGVVLVHPVGVAIGHRHVPKHDYNRWWFYLIWTIALTGLVIFIGINRQILFGYEPFRIRSVSMSPSIELDDFVLADTWRYRNPAPAAGEIVIVERPENPGEKYIKRIVAVSGDSVEIRDGTLYRNGQAIAEPYVHAPVPYPGSPRDVAKSILGPGLMYVLGDFRDNSLDSRQWGPLTAHSLRGRVQYIWLSMDARGF